MSLAGKWKAWGPWSRALVSWRASGNTKEAEGHRGGTEPQPGFEGRGSELLRGPRGSWALEWNAEWTGVHAGPEQNGSPTLLAWGGGVAVGGAGRLQEGDDSGRREGLVDPPRSSNFIPRTAGSIKGF